MNDPSNPPSEPSLEGPTFAHSETVAPTHPDPIIDALGATAATPHPTSSASFQRQDSRLHQGAKLGRYVVLSQLGAGGMGVVYAAYDPELDRKLAIKLLLSTHSRADAAHARLLREAQAMAKLDHPNVVPVFDVGEHQDSIYVAMEFIQGVTLGDWLREARGWEDTLQVFLQAARGLEAAHAAGMVHRDFKPDNVMVGKDGRVRVMDFGLVSDLGDGEVTGPGEMLHAVTKDSRTSSRNLTEVGALMGTPAYMAPEQFLGRKTDHRTDQFSFCVALWEGLFSERPFAGDNLADIATAVTRGRRNDAPRGSTVPRWLRTICERGLATSPDDRFASMGALVDAVQAEIGSVHARYRRRCFAAAMAAIAMCIGAAVAVTEIRDARWADFCTAESTAWTGIWGPDQHRQIDDAFTATKHPAARETMERLPTRLDSWTSQWQEEMHRACMESTRDEWKSNHPAVASCLTEQVQRLEALVEELEAIPKQKVPLAINMALDLPRPLDCARISDARAESYASASEPMRMKLVTAENHLLTQDRAEAKRLANEVLASLGDSGSNYLRARAELTLAAALQLLGDFNEAEAAYLLSVEHAISAGDEALLADATLDLAYLVGYKLNRPDEGRIWANWGEYLAGREQNEPALARASEIRANVLFALGDYQAAKRLAEKALEIRKRDLGQSHPDVAESLNDLGGIEAKLGRQATAEAMLRQAIGLRRAAFGPNSPEVAQSLHNLADIVANRDLEEAGRLLEESIQIRVAVLGPRHADLALSWNNLGWLHGERKEWEQAAHAHREALDIRLETLSNDHLLTLASQNQLARAYVELGRLDDAAVVAHALEQSLHSKKLQPEAIMYCWSTIGLVREKQGRGDDARWAFETALDAAMQSEGPGAESQAKKLREKLQALSPVSSDEPLPTEAVGALSSNDGR
jgi:tetratricopeptide (TPR) repeat protein/predicted Ser/Thr protein kinase